VLACSPCAAVLRCRQRMQTVVAILFAWYALSALLAGRPVTSVPLRKRSVATFSANIHDSNEHDGAEADALSIAAAAVAVSSESFSRVGVGNRYGCPAYNEFLKQCLAVAKVDGGAGQN
jgi:hypothetical protein